MSELNLNTRLTQQEKAQVDGFKYTYEPTAHPLPLIEVECVEDQLTGKTAYDDMVAAEQLGYGQI